MTKLCLLHSISQEAYIIWLWFLVHICTVMTYPVAFFFIFSKFCFLRVRWVKGRKIAQNNKKFCLSDFLSQQPYLVWLWFLLHMCKMMISPGIFFSFHFFTILSVKIQSVTLYISRTVDHIIKIFGTQV